MRVLYALERPTHNWRATLVADTPAALERLRQRPADVVVARLPTVADTENLFARLRSQCPGAIRVALPATEPTPVRGAHQVMALRSDLADLFALLAAAVEVCAVAARSDALRRVVNDFEDVPSPPLLYFDLRERFDDASSDADTLAGVASRDPALVARTLKLANSGFYARPRSIGSLTEAIGVIGTDALLGLVLAAHLFSGMPPPGLRLDRLWEHATQVSALAGQIVRIEGGDRNTVSHGLLAGLLHDIGLMVLVQNEPAQYQPVLKASAGDESSLVSMELEAFGVTHGELGSLILKLWNLPPAVVDAVANSHAVAADDQAVRSTLGPACRAVLAAEWLLNGDLPADRAALPDALAHTTDKTLGRWFDARDRLVSRAA